MKLLKIIVLLAFVSCNTKFKAHCKLVCDGDSFYLKDGREVRILYVDCPENTRGHNQAFGHEATQFSRKYLEGQEVVLKSHGRDKYHRLLCEVYLPDGRYFEKMLIDSGMGYAYKKYSPAYLYNLELKAKENKVGLWAYPHIPPYKFRNLITTK